MLEKQELATLSSSSSSSSTLLLYIDSSRSSSSCCLLFLLHPRPHDMAPVTNTYSMSCIYIYTYVYILYYIEQHFRKPIKLYNAGSKNKGSDQMASQDFVASLAYNGQTLSVFGESSVELLPRTWMSNMCSKCRFAMSSTLHSQTDHSLYIYIYPCSFHSQPKCPESLGQAPSTSESFLSSAQIASHRLLSSSASP